MFNNSSRIKELEDRVGSVWFQTWLCHEMLALRCARIEEALGIEYTEEMEKKDMEEATSTTTNNIAYYRLKHDRWFRDENGD